MSTYASTIEGSVTMEITALANQLKAEGKPVIGMSAGEPDFDTPNYIKEAAIKAIHEGQTKYTAAAGLPALKQLIADKILKDRGVAYTPNQIVVSCGAKHSIFNCLTAIVNPGDDIIFSSPYWVSYPDQVKLLGGNSVVIPTTDATQFKISPDMLAAAITPKTKALILNSPSNPTGIVYSRNELQALANVIVDHQILVISDEIYGKLTYGQQHVSIASLGEDIKQLTLFVDGVSKAYSMTGWRVGYTASPVEIATVMGRVQSHTTSNPTTPSQWASMAALKNNDDAIDIMRAEFSKRKEVMVAKLNAIEGVTCVNPQGAFYAFPNISALFGKSSSMGPIHSSVDFCKQLLQQSLVACVPGSGFGAEGYVRLSYATSMAAIEEALERLKKFAEALQ